MIPRCFRLDDPLAYGRWRDWRLAHAPASVAELVVEVADIAHPSAPEADAIRQRLRRANMAVYAGAHRQGRDHKADLKALAAALGLHSLDANALADDDGITPLAVHREGARARYIPYTERPIAWHTDGYYNPPARTVRSLLLHCAGKAASGGANRLMDAEILYILLRERDPELIRLLLAPDALTIPGNEEEGLSRPETVGPVFSLNADGSLHMRYTARTRNAIWSEAALPAAQAIREILEAPSPYIFEHVLEPGQGLVSNNPLHTREPFQDDPASPRLLFRARFHERIEGT